MTITKFTFFSPAGNNYPVTANADGKLYMALGNLPYTSFDRKDWSPTTQTGLTKTYVNTSFVVAGRYFEVKNHLISLIASANNFIHISIDLSTPLDPVSFSIGTSDQSNTVDINNGSGIYKRCIEVIQTNGNGIIQTTRRPSTRVIEDISVTNATISSAKLTNLDVSNAVTFGNGANITGKLNVSELQVYNGFISNNGTFTDSINVSKNVRSATANVTGSTTVGSLTSNTSVQTKTLTVKPNTGARSAAFQTPTIYSTIDGTAIQEFVLYRNGNVVTGTFADIRVEGGIPTNGAIIGWIKDNAFKPEFTQKFTMYTKNGKRVLLSVDTGGAFRNWGDAISAGDEIFGGVFWICEGTEGGIR